MFAKKAMWSKIALFW